MKKLLILVWVFLFACGNNGENRADVQDTSNADGRLIGDSIHMPDTTVKRDDSTMLRTDSVK